MSGAATDRPQPDPRREPTLVETPAPLERGERTGERRDSISRRMLAAADLIAVAVAALVAGELAGDRASGAQLLVATLPTLLAWLILFKLYHLYERDAKRITHLTLDDLPWLSHALLVGTLLLWGYTKVAPVEQLSFAEAALFGVTALLAAAIGRATVRSALPRLLGPERVLLTGSEAAVAPLVRRFAQNPKYGLLAVGRLAGGDERHPPGLRGAGSSPPFLGPIAELADAARLDRRR